MTASNVEWNVMYVMQKGINENAPKGSISRLQRIPTLQHKPRECETKGTSEELKMSRNNLSVLAD